MKKFVVCAIKVRNKRRRYVGIITLRPRFEQVTIKVEEVSSWESVPQSSGL